MQLQDDIRSLAEQIGDRHSSDRSYTLVLGSEIATAAGLPPLEQLVAEAGLSPADAADRRIIERLLWDRPVPPFMYDAAGLVRDGFFPRVITTGYDNLLERALVDAGLRNGNHFAVVDLGADAGRQPSPGSARIRIVRCHGATVIRPGAMDRAMGMRFEAGRTVLVVVGYQFESPALEGWLASLDGCELWWVSPTGDGGAASRIGWRGEWHTVTGEATTPETFFGQLSLLLVHLPTASAGSLDEAGTSPGDDELDALYLHSRLDQANVVRRSIEQRITSGADPAAVKQLRAQDDEISRLGQSYQTPAAGAGPSAANAASELLGRFEVLRAQLEPLVADGSAPVDQDTLAFVDGQIDALRREATKTDANATVVTAASAAMDGLLQTVTPYLSQAS